MEVEKIVQRCIQGDEKSQRLLYEQFKHPLFTVCLRYGRDRSEAEDMFQEGFIRIFKDLHQFKGNGPIGAWMRKVMVHSALQYIRKWKRGFSHLEFDEEYMEELSVPETAYAQLGVKELTDLIQRLPIGYRTVFNLFVIEGYSHREISEQLGISENTSKTQLFKAKAALRAALEKLILS